MKKEVVTISKQFESNPAMNFETLREEGLKHILNLGRRLWTDYNSHDAGVTIKEILCYAITDLGYRINLPMEDLIAEKNNNLSLMHEKFLSALNILPSCPITPKDYQKLFINRIEVNNVWVEKGDYELYANCSRGTYQPCQPEKDSQYQKVCINGLYKFWIELRDKSYVYPKLDKGEEEWTTSDKEKIKHVLKGIYHQNRNLGEDLLDICFVQDYGVRLCAHIELEPSANLAEVYAMMMFGMEQYFAPPIRHYSLQEMLDKDIPTDEIFEGVALKNGEDYKGGFIMNDDLDDSYQERKIHMSDIIRIVMDIPGVKIIRKIFMGECNADITDDAEGQWSMCIPRGYKPVVCEKSVFSFFKDVVPITLSDKVLAEAEVKLRALRLQSVHNDKVMTEDMPMPNGTYYDLSEYTSIHNHFPDTYGVNAVGLPSSVGEKRLAQAKQLKSYLLFFDQILANYFSQLSNAKELLNANSTFANTYFTQVVNDIAGVDELWKTPTRISDNLDTIMGQFDDSNARTNQLLDHLLARFAVDFNDYAFLLFSTTEANLDEPDIEKKIIHDKIDFLKNFKELSCKRGSAFDYCTNEVDVWDTDNVSGLAQRIAFLTGLESDVRQNLFIKIKTDVYATPSGKFKFCLLDDNGDAFLVSNKLYDNEVAATKELLITLELLETITNLDYRAISKTSFKVVLSTASLMDSPEHSPRIMASSTKVFESLEDAKKRVLELRHFIKIKNGERDRGGLFIVEHQLLRPVHAMTTVCTNHNVFCDKTIVNPGPVPISETETEETESELGGEENAEWAEGSKEKALVVKGEKEQSLDIKEEVIGEDVLVEESENTEGTDDGPVKEVDVDGSSGAEDDAGEDDAADSDIGTAPSNQKLPFFPLGECDDCKDFDPYSFKVTVVLPGWTKKLSDMDYRKFIEKTIRMEMPAHILPKICFISPIQMLRFEMIYKLWLGKKHEMCCVKGSRFYVNPYTGGVIGAINQLENYYPNDPKLSDCSSDKPGLILGRTNL